MSTNPDRRSKKKGRKRGDWKNLAASRSHFAYDLPVHHGLSNIPSFGDTGSAAYRRLLAHRGRRTR